MSCTSRFPRFRSKVDIETGYTGPITSLSLPVVAQTVATPAETTGSNSSSSFTSAALPRRSAPISAEDRQQNEIKSLSAAEAQRRLLACQPEISRLKEEAAHAKEMLDEMEKQKAEGAPPLSFERMTTDPKITKYLKSYTGFVSPGSLGKFYNVLNWNGACERVQIYRGPADLAEGAGRRRARPRQAGRALMPKDALVLTLFMLRTGCTERTAAGLFGVSTDTVSRYFVSWLVFMATFFEAFFPYPTAEQLNETTNERLREAILAGDVASKMHFEAFIDCHEQEMERPRDKTVARAVWSDYKQRTTAKFLGAISGCGAFTFLSTAFPGRITDPSITKLSGFLDKIHKNGMTSADKGFMMHYEFAENLHYLAVPAKARRGQKIFDTDQNFHTATIARKRIHVERAFRRAQEFEILHRRIPITQADIWGMVFSVPCYLTNFQPPLMDERDHGHGDSEAQRATKRKRSKKTKKAKKEKRQREEEQEESER